MATLPPEVIMPGMAIPAKLSRAISVKCPSRYHVIETVILSSESSSKKKPRFTGYDDKIISLYARGMTTREIQGHLEKIYGVDVSPNLISTATDAVNNEVKIWQNMSRMLCILLLIWLLSV